jgi:hypothetical protein
MFLGTYVASSLDHAGCAITTSGAKFRFSFFVNGTMCEWHLFQMCRAINGLILSKQCKQNETCEWLNSFLVANGICIQGAAIAVGSG